MRSKQMTLKGKKVDVLLEAGSREVREVLAALRAGKKGRQSDA